MKNLIFPVLTVLCFQFCRAQWQSSNCEEKLATLNGNALTFFTDFKDLHDKTHDIVAEAARLCVTTFNAEYTLLGNNYATNINDGRSAVKRFTDGAAGAAAQFINYFNSILASCDKLLGMGGEFMEDNDITCPFGSIIGRGCDATLRSRRCELSAFLKDIKAQRDKAVSLLNGMISGVKGLVNTVDSFTSANDLTIVDNNSSDADFHSFKVAVNQFIDDFQKRHWSSHTLFINLQIICDYITRTVSALQLKYSYL